MKILHYINNLGSGGAEKLLTDILPLIKQKGHNVYVVYSNNRANIKDYDEILTKSGIKILNFNTSFYNPLQIFGLIRLIKKEKFDIIHAHLFPTQYWLAFASFFIRKAKLVKTEHNVYNQRRKYAFLSVIEKIVYNRYSKIIAITNEVQASLAKWLKNENKIVVIYNGVNLQKINSTSNHADLNGYKLFGKDNINILMTGRFNGIAKDQKTLIYAAGLLPENYHVYFAGEGELLENSQRLAKELKINHRVHFLGMRTDVMNLMKIVNLNVLSTNYEGLSGVALESLASGKPFIGSDVPGINNVVPNDNFLFPVKSPQKLAQKIKEVTENNELAANMIISASTHIKKFDIRLMVDGYLKVYTSI